MELTPKQLREIAEGPVNYEVRTLVQQVQEVMSRERDPSDPVYLALIEAPLVHFRLLDDFLGGTVPKPGGHDDVVAKHYLESWKPTRFLEEPVRDAINAQLQHLAARRANDTDWYPHELLATFAHAFLKFTSELAEANDERAYWFNAASSWCQEVLGETGYELYPSVAHGS